MPNYADAFRIFYDVCTKRLQELLLLLCVSLQNRDYQKRNAFAWMLRSKINSDKHKLIWINENRCSDIYENKLKMILFHLFNINFHAMNPHIELIGGIKCTEVLNCSLKLF